MDNPNQPEMTEKPLTPGEIRKMLDVTDATIRNYCKRFSQFLTPEATRKNRKRFSPDDVKILVLAKSYLDDGYTYDQTINLLENQNFDDILDQPLPEKETPQESEPDETSALAIYQETIKAKDQYIDELKEDKDRLQKEVTYLRLPWYRKIFRDPPE